MKDEVEPSDEAGIDIPTMRAVMEAQGPAWQRLIASDIDPATVVIEYEDAGETHAPLGIRLAQALHHGTDHRSQVCTALTTLGIKPPAIDVWDFAGQDGRLFSLSNDPEWPNRPPEPPARPRARTCPDARRTSGTHVACRFARVAGCMGCDPACIRAAAAGR